MARVRLERLSRTFGSGLPAVDHLTLELASGEFFCLLGPSGCGKSTLLRLVGGYLKPDSGRVWLDEADVTEQPPERRRTGMVFQNYALFPHLSSLDNVAFALRVRGVAKAERHAQAREMLDWVGLTLSEGRRRPGSLSGGQQQRVALARALMGEPRLLMLDEPFANLDRLLRERLREETLQIQRRAGTTTILVTHDREEALAMADRIAVMEEGQLLQVGSPQELHDCPASEAVAGFLGFRNLYRIERVEDGAVVAAGTRFLVTVGAVGDCLLLRSELLILHATSHPGALPGRVRQNRFAGSFAVVTVALESGAVVEVQQSGHQSTFGSDEPVWLEIPPDAAMAIPGGKDNP